jgi:hypothetical protein
VYRFGKTRVTRSAILEKLDEEDSGGDELRTLQKLIDAQNCDLF